MSQSLLNFLRSRIWTLTFALALAGAAVLLLGPRALWGLIAFSLAAALIIRFIAPPAVAPRPVEPRPEGAVAMLPTLTRLLLEQLPMPVMLLDASQRVLFVNEPMRALLGGGALRSPVSALFRNPAVLEAIDHTVKTGEPGNMPFTLPVPIERHFQAYTAAISTAPAANNRIITSFIAVTSPDTGADTGSSQHSRQN